jgi:hypothetical protein
MTIVTLVSGCGYAYPGDGTRESNDQNLWMALGGVA